jgi:hypothetical protein
MSNKVCLCCNRDINQEKEMLLEVQKNKMISNNMKSDSNRFNKAPHPSTCTLSSEKKIINIDELKEKQYKNTIGENHQQFLDFCSTFAPSFERYNIPCQLYTFAIPLV